MSRLPLFNVKIYVDSKYKVLVILIFLFIILSMHAYFLFFMVFYISKWVFHYKISQISDLINFCIFISLVYFILFKKIVFRMEDK